MITSLPIDIWKMPGVERLFEGIANDLANGRCAILVTPSIIEHEQLWDFLQTYLRNYSLNKADLSQLLSDKPSVTELVDYLYWGWTTGELKTVENLLKSRTQLEIIYLSDIISLNPDMQDKWWKFIMRWAYLDQSSSFKSPLLVIVTADGLPDEKIIDYARISKYWWWGMPSQLEQQVYCRIKNINDVFNIRSRWREHVIPSIAGNDFYFTEYLWGKINNNTEKILKFVIDYAKDRKWKREMLDDETMRMIMHPKKDETSLIMNNPPEKLISLWSKGIIGWTHEHGLELHTAALAMMGQKERVYHRLWRGQSMLMMPIIDGLRLNICDKFTLRHGDNWPVFYKVKSFEEELSIQETPYACQWGHLLNIVRNVPQMRDERYKYETLISKAHSIRNELSHYKPITFADFESLIKESGSKGIFL